MREIQTEIDALPAAVWEVLADIETYEKWNLRITHVRGELREGGSIDIAVDRIGEKSRTMTVRVFAVQPPPETPVDRDGRLQVGVREPAHLRCPLARRRPQ